MLVLVLVFVLVLVLVLLLVVVLLLVLEVDVEIGREDKMWRCGTPLAEVAGQRPSGDADTPDAPAADPRLCRRAHHKPGHGACLFRCLTVRVCYAVSARTRFSRAVTVAETTLRSPWARSALMSWSAISARILALSATRTRCSLQRAHGSG